MDKGLSKWSLIFAHEKVFDCVDYDMLKRKLFFYGVQESASDWLTSCTNNWIQLDKLN